MTIRNSWIVIGLMIVVSCPKSMAQTVSFKDGAQLIYDIKAALTTNNICAAARQEAVCRYMEQLHTNLVSLSESWQQHIVAMEDEYNLTINTLKKEHEEAQQLVSTEKIEAVEEVRTRLFNEIEKVQSHLALVLTTNEQQESLVKTMTDERTQLQTTINEKNSVIEHSKQELERLTLSVNSLQEEKNTLLASLQETNNIMATLNGNLQSTQWEVAHLDSLLQERAELKTPNEVTAEVLKQKDEVLKNALQEHRILQGLIEEKNGIIEHQKLEIVSLASAKEGTEQITSSIKDSYQMAQDTIKTLQAEITHLQTVQNSTKESESSLQFKLQIADLEKKISALLTENKLLEKKQVMAHAPILAADQEEIRSKFAQLQMETAKQTAYIKKVEHMYGGHEIVHNQLQDHAEVSGLLDTALVILAGR